MLNMIFKGVKPFIHEVTLAKFRFISGDYTSELLKIIDKSLLPKEYGGEAPNLDDIQ